MKKLLVGLTTTFALFIVTDSFARTEKSEYRPNTNVEFIYEQPLDNVYSTNWLAKLEKKQDTKRLVYIETVGKYVNKGFIEFDCKTPKSDVNFSLYNWDEFGDDNHLEKFTVHQHEINAWKNGTFKHLLGEDPPYYFYKKLRIKYCKG